MLYCAAQCCTVLCCTVLHGVVLCCTVLHCVVLCSTVLHCAVQCCTVQHSVALCCIVLYGVVLCCTVLHCAAQCCTVLYIVTQCCTVLHSVALCCTVLHCAALCYTLLHSVWFGCWSFPSLQHPRSYQDDVCQCTQWLYSAAPLGDHATDTMTLYPTQSHYHTHWAYQSLPYPINTECQTRKRHVSIWWVIGLTRPWNKLLISHMRVLHSINSTTGANTPVHSNIHSLILSTLTWADGRATWLTFDINRRAK